MNPLPKKMNLFKIVWSANQFNLFKKMGLKILLITTGQPSCNPRVVKEADALAAAEHEVTLLYCFFIKWAEEKDRTLLQNVKWKFIMAGGSPFKNKILFLFIRLRNRFCKLLNQWGVQHFLFAERTQARCYDELIRKAKRIEADWYIAHNLGDDSPLMLEMLNFMDGKGFQAYDISQFMRRPYDKALYQLDMFFVKKNSPLIGEKRWG